MSFFLAVDCGGTKTAAAIADASGNIIGRGLGGPSNITYLTPDAFIAAVAAAVKLALYNAVPNTQPVLPPEGEGASPFAAAWFGISGADSPAAIARVAPQLSALLALPPGPRLQLANDTALLAAPLRMHADVRAAVAAIAGTGSIAVAFARGADGAPLPRARAGGWGWILGDEGGGFALGRTAVRAVLRAHDADGRFLVRGPLVRGVLAHFGVADVMEVLPVLYAPDPPPLWAQRAAPAGLAAVEREKRLSMLPRLVFQAAFDQQDPLAMDVVKEAAAELAEQIERVLAPAGVYAAESVLCFGGSLAGVPKYRDLILADLRRRGHMFRRMVFVDDPAALAAEGLATAFKNGEQEQA